MNKKIQTILICGLLLFGGLLFADRAMASITEMEGQLSAAAEEGAGYSEPQDPRVTAATIIRAALSLIGIIFLVLTLYAGALWMMSGGNEEQITKAKNTLKASIIGLVIVICAYSITIFVAYLAIGGNRDALKVNPPSSENQPFNP
ncbi:MAG: pilin [Candidatus Magasanikbacteria bacterium]|nr:pilin [Candidatus Magasanikbacteria bacterium]